MKPLMYSSPSDGERWDASFHNIEIIERENELLVQGWCRVRDIAAIKKEKPRQNTNKFTYIDIDSVDSKTGFCFPKQIDSQNRPSRAQRLVNKGDVLVSLVRPNRKCVLYIDEELDGAVCTTGLGILSTENEEHGAWIFSCLMSSFSAAQLSRRSRSTMYPTINTDDLLELIIPPFNEADAKKVLQQLKRIEEIRLEASTFREGLTF